MAATYSKPTKIPRWADTTAWILEPSSGKKDLGWEFEEAPASNYENWIQKLTGDWFKWIDERFFDGGSEDELDIYTPGAGARRVRVRDAGVEIFGSALGFDSSASIPRIYFNGLGGGAYLEVDNSTGRIQIEAGVLGTVVYSVPRDNWIFFSDLTDGLAGMGFARVTGIPDKNLLLLSTQAGEGFPAIFYDPANAFIGFSFGRSTYNQDPAATGLVEFYDSGSFIFKSVTGAGTVGGPVLALQNPDRTTAHSWAWGMSNDTLFLASFTSGTILEKFYIWFQGPANDEVWFDQDAELIPGISGSGPSGKLGNSTRWWEEITCGELEQKRIGWGFWSGTNKNVPGDGSRNAVTPDQLIVDDGFSAISIAGNTIRFLKNGVYSIEYVAAIQETAPSAGQGINFRLEKNGGPVIGFLSVHTIDSSVAREHPSPFLYMVESTSPSDTYTITAQTSGNPITIGANSKLKITQVRRDL